MATRDDESYRLWRTRKTVCQMLRDRGYIVQQQDLDMDFTTFQQRFSTVISDTSSGAQRYGPVNRSQIGLITNLHNDPSANMFVFFPDQTNIGVAEIKEIYSRMKENQTYRAILVMKSPAPGTMSSSKHGILSSAKKAIESLNAEPSKQRYIIEPFKETELLVNITEHVLVPQHVPLDDEETRALLDRYKLKLTQLPRIKITDPVARYFGLQRRQVVKIIRPSETAGRYVTYRLVV